MTIAQQTLTINSLCENEYQIHLKKYFASHALRLKKITCTMMPHGLI